MHAYYTRVRHLPTFLLSFSVCPKGTVLNQTRCDACPEDTYKMDTRSPSCVPCPNRTTTYGRTGTNNCSFCKTGEVFFKQGSLAPDSHDDISVYLT